MQLELKKFNHKFPTTNAPGYIHWSVWLLALQICKVYLSESSTVKDSLGQKLGKFYSKILGQFCDKENLEIFECFINSNSMIEA